MLLFFSLPIILHVCLAMQQSDELRIKIGSKFARRQATDYKYTDCIIDQCERSITRAAAAPTTVYFFNAATPRQQHQHCYRIIHRPPTEKCSAQCFNSNLVGYGQLGFRVWVRVWVRVTVWVNATQNPNPQGSTATLTHGPQIR